MIKDTDMKSRHPTFALASILSLCLLVACSEESPTNTTETSIVAPEIVKDKVDTAPTADSGVYYYGLTQDLNRSSDLAQINTGNVKNLAPVWSLALGEKIGLQTQPLVIGDVMYVTTHNSTHAINAISGRQIWKTLTDYPAGTVNCCGSANRGLAYYKDKLYRANLDNRIIALDPDTGEILWEKKVHDVEVDYSMTSTPIIANDVLITGMAGGDFGARGLIDGWNPETGEHLWRFHVIPKPGEPGSETWEGDTWKLGGGGTWITGSYDAELDMIYWGTGNPAPWNAQNRPGDNLHTSSMLALKPRTGELVWHFQFTPNDSFDYDGNGEPVLTELTIDGELRKVLIQANRNGFFYVLDRTNGEFISAKAFVNQTLWTDGIDEKTGRPLRSEAVDNMLKTGQPIIMSPTAFGGKNVGPMSYSSRTGFAYVNAIESEWLFTPTDVGYEQGLLWFGANFEWTDVINRKGELKAIDPLTGKAKWSFATTVPMNGGTLVTAGNLVFSGAQTGELYAFNADTGDKLWEYRTSSGIIAPPVTYQIDGKQYVAVGSGIGGLYAAVSGDLNIKNINPGNSIWVFALNEGSQVSTPQSAALKPPVKSDETEDKAMSAEVVAGKALYDQSCAQCHGANRISSGTNYDLAQFPEDEQRFLTALIDGKGSMPAWANKYSREEMSSIYAYIRH
jgi:alcohol dehydrogenase (cytochrome c)